MSASQKNPVQHPRRPAVVHRTPVSPQGAGGIVACGAGAGLATTEVIPRPITAKTAARMEERIVSGIVCAA